MSEKILTLQYTNSSYLFCVYGSEDKTTYILEAIFPGVGWEKCTMLLSEDEIGLLKKDENQFSEFVIEFTNNRKSKKFATRRIESQVKRIPSTDKIIYRNEK